MIWRTLQVLCVVGCAVTVPVQAQDNDPGHGTPGHRHPAKPAAEESTIEFLWRKSDDAFHAGDYERAIACHKAIVALAPDEIQSYAVGAWLLWSLGKGDEALAFLQRGLDRNPDDWEMWEAAGNQYDLQKKRPEARAAYVRSVALIPATENSQMLRRRLAHAAERDGDLTLSLQTWRDLVRDFPNDVVNQNNLARVEGLQKAGG
jgi:tetratricopeptide (TPR) repeat protein